jgi:ABC-2 type transport system ATP-binding protein
VPQELALYDQLSGRENLIFFGRLYGLTGPALARRVQEVLSAVGLEDRADRKVATFSGGMKRRLNLGAALVHEPRLLLLDEPTTGVDPQSRNHIFEEIRRLNRAGATVVYTSHYMEEVQSLCPRVGILDHGKLIACDMVAELLRKQDGLIRFRVPAVTPVLRERIGRIPDARLVENDSRPLEIVCRDVKATLPQLMALLADLKLPVLTLETEEPNLERVFLGLTGSALRD